MGEQHAVGGPFWVTHCELGRAAGAWAARSQELATLSSSGHLPRVIAAASGGVRCGAEDGMWRMLAGNGVRGEGAAGAEGAQISPPPPVAPDTPWGGWPGYMGTAV